MNSLRERASPLWLGVRGLLELPLRTCSTADGPSSCMVSIARAPPIALLGDVPLCMARFATAEPGRTLPRREGREPCALLPTWRGEAVIRVSSASGRLGSISCMAMDPGTGCMPVICLETRRGDAALPGGRKPVGGLAAMSTMVLPTATVRPEGGVHSVTNVGANRLLELCALIGRLPALVSDCSLVAGCALDGRALCERRGDASSYSPCAFCDHACANRLDGSVSLTIRATSRTFYCCCCVACCAWLFRNSATQRRCPAGGGEGS